jgi:hypothetical protein
VSYLQLLTAASKSKDAAKAEEIFLEAKNNPSKPFADLKLNCF